MKTIHDIYNMKYFTCSELDVHVGMSHGAVIEKILMN